MRKEPIIAIVLGSLIGIIVAFGVWRFTKTSQNIQKSKETLQELSKDKESKTNKGLEVLEPLHKQVFSENPVRVAGISSQDTMLAIYVNDEYVLMKAEQDGSFETEVKLSGGEQIIEIWSLGEEIVNISIPVVFSSQVEGKNNTALLGTLTDISEESLQIKTVSDQIEQISVNEDTSYANIVKASTDVEFSELAIGDYIIAIGTLSKNSVLESSRILVSAAPKDSSNIAIKGVIKTLSSSEFIVESNGETFSIDATGGISVTKFDEEGEIIKAKLAEATEEEEIIIFGLLEDGELQAEAIHVFPEVEE